MKCHFCFISVVLLLSCVMRSDIKTIVGYSADDDYNEYYIFYNTANLHEIEIQIIKEVFDTIIRDAINYDAEYKSAVQDEMQSEEFEDFHNYQVNKYYNAKFLYRGVLGNITIDNIGIRTRGNWYSRKLIFKDGEFYRSHFKIKFNETFDIPENTKEYDDLKKRSFACQNEFSLRWSLNEPGYYKDTTQLKEMYCYNLFNKAGIISKRAAKTKLYLTVDGKRHYYGLYNIIEDLDKKFLKKRFGKKGNDGNLYKCIWDSIQPTLTIDSISQPEAIGIKDWERFYTPAYDLKTNKEKSDYSNLIDFITNLNTKTGDDFVNYIDEHFAVDEFLKCIALNFLVGNFDDYRGSAHNYYLYFHNNGRIYYIPDDLENAFAGNSWDGFIGGVPPNTNLLSGWQKLAAADIYKYIFVDFYGNSPERPLVTKILDVQKYREKYNAYLAQFINSGNGLFNYKDFELEFNKKYEIYKDYVANEMFPDEIMSLDDGDNGNMSERDYFETKIKAVAAQLNL